MRAERVACLSGGFDNGHIPFRDYQKDDETEDRRQENGVDSQCAEIETAILVRLGQIVAEIVASRAQFDGKDSG
jgi:hypothetical protein